MLEKHIQQLFMNSIIRQLVRMQAALLSMHSNIRQCMLMQVSFWSMPLYSVLPAVTEYAVEQGWTRAYTRISDVGLGWYLAYFVMYMTCVEFFVYWMHRGLHDVKIGYK